VSPGSLLVIITRYHSHAYDEIQAIFSAVEPAAAMHLKYLIEILFSYGIPLQG
jgi:hypothetical protein